jgi:hypothetical protein
VSSDTRQKKAKEKKEKFLGIGHYPEIEAISSLASYSRISPACSLMRVACSFDKKVESCVALFVSFSEQN